MKLTDRLGNQLDRGDAVTFSEPQLVGVITEISSGDIARPVSIDSTGVKAQMRPPSCVVTVQFASAMFSPSGQFEKLIKVHKPSTDADKVIK